MSGSKNLALLGYLCLSQGFFIGWMSYCTLNLQTAAVTNKKHTIYIFKNFYETYKTLINFTRPQWPRSTEKFSVTEYPRSILFSPLKLKSNINCSD